MASWPDRKVKRCLRWSAGRVVALLLAGLAAGGPSAARGEATFYQERVGPLLDRHCVACHGPEKQKGRLRLDSFEWMMKGGVSGEVVRPGDLKGSELHRRIILPATDEEVMPADGKPLLSPAEIRTLELWILKGASLTLGLAEFPEAPALGRPAAAAPPLAPDWRPRAAAIAQLERQLGVRLVPRSAVATDGLVLRTASSPARCDDAAIAALAPVAELIVEAELARTRITDAGLPAVGGWRNLRRLDLTRTTVTSAGIAGLVALQHLEALNLTDTAIDDAGLAAARALPAQPRVWFHGSRASTATLAAPAPAK